MIATFPSRQVAKMLNLTDVQRRLVPASWTKWSKGLVFGDRYKIGIYTNIHIHLKDVWVKGEVKKKGQSCWLLTLDSWSESKNYEHFSVFPFDSFLALPFPEVWEADERSSLGCEEGKLTNWRDESLQIYAVIIRLFMLLMKILSFFTRESQHIFSTVHRFDFHQLHQH